MSNFGLLLIKGSQSFPIHFFPILNVFAGSMFAIESLIFWFQVLCLYTHPIVVQN